ncbi:hypothetical protein [Leptodesmis sp.]|uniref:hypothetical protein n=1 Tax=Leptodesmis sp. TaxID=3100501 RepID=UPI0040534724
MQQHRVIVGQEHQGRGREIISLDWPLSHHEDGIDIYGTKRSSDYVNCCMSGFQTVVTVVTANPQQIDGLAVEVQILNFSEAERGYLKMTAQPSYEEMEQLIQRLVELLHHQKNQLAYRKRTEMVVDIVRQIGAEGQFPKADYAFDNRVLTLALKQLIEASGKRWVKQYWAFTQTVRLKRYGRRRLVIVHEQEDFSDLPRFLLTDALYWESARTIQTWSYRWACESFHAFCKQVTGFESAQVRNQEAVNATSAEVV